MNPATSPAPTARRATRARGLLALVAFASMLVLVACSSDGAGPTTTVVLRLEASGDGAVRVDGVQRSLPYQQSFAVGTSVTLQAQPAAGFAFDRWEGGLTGGQNPATVAMAGTRNVTAVFAPIQTATHPLTVTRVGAGSATIASAPAGIACGTTCQATFAEGSAVTLTATPAAGSLVAGWTGCDAAVGTVCTVTMQAARSVVATIDLVGAQPANDDFADRVPLTGATGSVSAANAGAGKEPNEPDHGGAPGGSSIWWTWTAPASGSYLFDIGGSSFQAVVAVYTGTTLAGLQVAPSPSSASVVPAQLQQAVQVAAVVGTAYQVAVDGVGGATGVVVLDWAPATTPSSVDWAPTPGSLAFTAPRGGDAPPPQALTIANVGDGDGAFSIASNRAWLTVAPSGGPVAAGAETQLEVTAGACTVVGSETGTLSISGSGDSAAVQVTRVCEGAIWQATPSAATFFGDVGGGAPAAQSVTLRNTGNVAADFAIASDRAWLSVEPTGGNLGANAQRTLQVSVDACTAIGVLTGSLSVTGGGHAVVVSVTRDCSDPSTLSLSIDRVYVNQTVPAQDTAQAASARVDLVANRGGLLRAFVTASESGAGSAQVRFHYRIGAGAETTVTLPGPSSVPTTTNEGTPSSTYNVVLPASAIQPNLQGYLTVTASTGGQSVSARYPATGWWSPRVRSVPAANFTAVPVTFGGTTPSVGSAQDYFDLTRRVYPLGDGTVGVQVRATPYTYSGTLSSGQGWATLLNELTTLRTSDGNGRHYVGIVNPGYTSGIAGIAWVGGSPVAVSWHHLPSASEVVAHELGHNWDRGHAPCGGAGNVDAGYPHAGGKIGVWGYDLTTGQHKSPTTFNDLMGYCDTNWISDYTYKGVMTYRGGPVSPSVVGLGADPAPLLIASGWSNGHEIELDPLVVVTGVAEPIAGGPYTLLAWDTAGAEVLRVPFDMRDLSHHDGDEHDEAFHLAIPLPERPLARVRIERDGVVLLERTSPIRTSAAVAPTVTRDADGGATVRWDARAYPGVLVLDGVDGPILGRGVDGELRVQPSGGILELLLSDGLNTVRAVIEF